ncbi:MAG: Trk family potassium uptake protein [Candidatus Sumerlaeaceae bacterium]|nr:Trk family potassium uptake protein [Candidatus Sumerlaeaceae bacterium]
MNRSGPRRPLLASMSPAVLILAGYLVTIAIGGVILWLPFCHTRSVTLGDALFTATSALCVTGLIVVDTATAYTTAGKIVLMLLMQIGGLGYMTITVVAVSALRRQGLLLTTRRLATMAGGFATLADILHIAKVIIVASCLAELALAVPLWFAFRQEHGALPAVLHALFHSVSAFNNAGFSSFSTGLVPYRDDGLVILPVMSLIVAGGLGFKVWRDLKHRVLERQPLDLHDKIVLSSTALLLIVPAGLFFLLESSFQDWHWGERLGASLFASVTPRTAGFNTVDYNQMSSFGLLMTMTLMFVGGSPGGTAGGVKTVTAVIVLAWTVATLRGRQSVALFRRTVPADVVVRAFQTVTIATLGLWGACMILSLVETPVYDRHGFLRILFELFSAFGTVGLSTGSATVANASLVADMGFAGRLVVAAAMVVGRAGYLIFAASLIVPVRASYEYAKGEVTL